MLHSSLVGTPESSSQLRRTMETIATSARVRLESAKTRADLRRTWRTRAESGRTLSKVRLNSGGSWWGIYIFFVIHLSIESKILIFWRNSCGTTKYVYFLPNPKYCTFLAKGDTPFGILRSSLYLSPHKAISNTRSESLSRGVQCMKCYLFF